MTTTLRPTGTEQHDDDRVSRAYDICVNSRPVGILRLSTDAEFGRSVGRIGQLVVEERERGRGRGAVAALAAEEVLREWGCTRVELSVPSRATGGLRFASALGYRERSRHMLKELADPREAGEPPHDLPVGSVARPMSEEEFQSWRERDRAMFRDALQQRGVPREQAEARVAASERELLPHGLASEGAVLRVLVHEGTPVGTVWVDLIRTPREDADAWIFAVEVAEHARRRGHGHSLVRTAEREALAAGRRTIGLNVHADNDPALRLYEGLGYRTVEHQLYKPLL